MFSVKPMIAGQARRNIRNGRTYNLHSQKLGRYLRARGGTAVLEDPTLQVVRSGGSVVDNSARMKTR